MSSDPLLDPLEDRRHVILDLPVPESQKPDSEFLQSGLSAFVMQLFVVMTSTVDFYRKLQILAEEVDDVLVYRPLAIKVVSEELLPFETLPQQNLGECHVPPEFPGVLYELRIVGDYPSSHNLPLPSPPRRGARWRPTCFNSCSPPGRG